MSEQKKRLAAVIAALSLSTTGCVIPTSEHPSVWTTIGAPQTWNLAGGHFINRRGGRPERELKPPIRRIADPANLESDVPAIKKAAEVKQAEDLKAQKIKAVRYLAESAGCGCYDEQGEITKALVAAMEDCTEEVRYATVKALLARAEQQRKSGPCAHCAGSCCNEKIIDQLAKMVWERDEKGCRIEPSERVRTTAKQVLQLCCPTRCQNYYATPAEVIPEPVEPPADPVTPPPKKEINLEGIPDVPASPDLNSGDNGDATPDQTTELDDGFPRFSSLDNPGSFSPVSYSSDNVPNGATAKTDVVTLRGNVQEIAAAEEYLLIAFTDPAVLTSGTTLQVRRRHQLGRIEYLGEVEVLDSEEGAAVVRPLGTLSIHRIGQGDSLMLSRRL